MPSFRRYAEVLNEAELGEFIEESTEGTWEGCTVFSSILRSSVVLEAVSVAELKKDSFNFVFKIPKCLC